MMDDSLSSIEIKTQKIVVQFVDYQQFIHKIHESHIWEKKLQWWSIKEVYGEKNL